MKVIRQHELKDVKVTVTIESTTLDAHSVFQKDHWPFNLDKKAERIAKDAAHTTQEDYEHDCQRRSGSANGAPAEESRG